MPLTVVLRRPSSMSFLIEEHRMKAKDEVLEAAVQAGYELVTKKTVQKKTVRRFEQSLMPKPMLVSCANFYLQQAVSNGFPFTMKRKA